ncbi:MAG: class B sortase [Bacilli bacterium]|nr:class B sortase [Bacilli bacterium]
MKKIIFLIVIVLLAIVGYFYFQTERYYNIQMYNEFILDSPNIEMETAEAEVKIEQLKENYKNDDIKAIVSIENTDFVTPVVQGKDNEYYLKHLPDGTYNINGSIFFDYRLDINKDQKLLIYGHSSEDYDLPLEIIENYQDEKYYENHKHIYLNIAGVTKKYEVVSAYVETSDFDYMKLEFKSGYDREVHYQRLLDSSFYDTGATLTEEDAILILQTCATLEEYKNYEKKYFLVIAKLIAN